MRIWFGGLAALVMMLGLAGCNTDALTPQAEIPNASQANRLADNQQPASKDQIQPLSADEVDTQPLDAQSTQTGPQNTLQAQAEALQTDGVNPVASEPIKVDARNKTIFNANPDANQQVAAIPASNGTIRFLPIIGAPVQAVTPLSRSLGAQARAAGLTIKSSSDNSSEHILKGYLSAFNDGQKTTVVYVWDVLDNSGQRLNRLQGQMDVQGPATDAWAAVPAETMTAIGADTIARYVAWKNGG